MVDPFDSVEWELRTASIKGEDGGVLFEQGNCEIPEGWSQLATNVVVSKYFYGELGTPERENSVRKLIHRVSRTIADWGIEDGYFATADDGENFYRELTWLCLHQHAAFNSPVWFNVGLYPQYGVEGAACNWHWDSTTQSARQPENPYEFPQGSACFIQSVRDDMEDIMELARSEAMLFKFGSGTGTDLSTLRSHREKLSGGGKPSGPLSFMRVYDRIAAVVKSGGKTRRAAKMQSLKIGHPDVMEFIECKQKEEEKARFLLAKGYNYEDAYSSVLFQNANLSVRVSDDFMEAVVADRPWTTRWVTDETREGPTFPARQMLDTMAQSAWACGDPGLQYDTTINRWHTCPNSGRINASNPCSEYMFLDDSACNLASVNLMKFRLPDGTFDVARYQAACRIVFIAQEILVDHASYPTAKITRNSHRFRPLGLGYSNLGSLIMTAGLPYDSDAARGICGAITALMHGTACRTSTELAAAVGPFDGFVENREPMLRVMEMHWEKVEEIDSCPEYLQTAARKVWDEVLAAGRRHGFRNAQGTVLAPTGTISFMMDCDTTGIEPDIALVKYKQLAGGGMLKIVNQMVPLALRTLGYDEAEVESIIAHIDREDTIEGAADLNQEHLPVFDCAFPAPNGTRCIPWRAHVRMMAAAQPFLSGAISKTVNMPKETMVEDVVGAYMEGWRSGL
ncbi:MAG: vitamin B12-dependent ribonucleotide reductase, partial [Planctomycetota bacterium]